ncbi:MAG: BlaI/MecI/CopY family transcriptional regulator [bacterium]|nr:BlaI/MecI/CopY family transcriptional regulator [bacterium]
MAERPVLSKWEMDVARVVWEIGPASVREIHEHLSKQRQIDFTTVQTYLRRMESKGYLNSSLKGRIRIYSSRTRPGTVIRENVNELVDRLFGGEYMPLVRHLIEDRGVDREKIAELRELIERLETEQQQKGTADE